MTEIPEHLLQRSRDRRVALTGGEGDAPAPAAAASAAPAVAAAAAAPAARAEAAAPAVSKPAPPPPPHVQAALRRKKIPLWAMPVLLGMPIWAYTYVGTLERPPEEAEGLLGVGETVYAESCSSCHGGSGGGGSGPALADGAVVETFPNPLSHVEWVIEGDPGWDEPTYGSQAKPVQTGMPAWASGLTQEQLLGVVFYERAVLGGDEVSLELAAHFDEMIEAGDLPDFEAEGNFPEDIALTELEDIFQAALEEAPEG